MNKEMVSRWVFAVDKFILFILKQGQDTQERNGCL